MINEIQEYHLKNFIDLVPEDHSPPYAWIGHVFFAQVLVNEMKPDIFVELGTHTGNSYFSFCQVVKTNNLKTKCFAIDTWKGDKHASYYEESVFNKVKKINNKYSDFSQLLKKTFDEGLEDFDNGSIDLLHIDGLHTYEAVKHDFLSWLPKLKKNAVILFHDINVFREDFGVYKFWSEIQEKYPLTFQFMHSYGLGVLQLGKKSDENILSIFKINKMVQKKLCESYEFIGSNYFDDFSNEIKINNLNQIISKSNADRKQLDNDKKQLENDKKQLENTLIKLYDLKIFRYTESLRHGYMAFRNFLKKII